MLILTQLTSRANAMFSSHDNLFNESQKLRVAALASYKAAGDALIAIRELLKPASKLNPIETDLGTFTSFSQFLDSGHIETKKTSAYASIKLAENWDIVLKLGMQDTTDMKTLSKSMRLNRTLRIIDWYKANVELGRNESELTLDQYWLEAEGSAPMSSGPTKRQLEQELQSARVTITQLESEVAALKVQLSRHLVLVA